MPKPRPTLERLEARTHLAADPAILGHVLESSWRVGDLGFGGSRSTAARVELSAMMRTRIQGEFSGLADVDVFRVRLTEGQYLNTRLDVPDARLTLYDARAKVAAKLWRPDALYRVPQSGTYYLRLADTSGTAARRAYTLDLRPIGLNSGEVDPNMLQSDASGLYVLRDGNALHITGPTGHGFSLLGNWRQRTTGSADAITTTYTLADSVTLRTIVGDLSVPIPPAARIRITTEQQTWGRYFGEIESIELGMSLSAMDIVTPLGRSWGTVFDSDVAGVNANGGGWGICLGSDPRLTDTELPLNPAVPYLFYTDTKGFTGSLGAIEVGAVGTFGYSVVLDPTDGFFIGAKGVPVVGDVAYGVSYAGLIPFEPNARPGAWDDEMFGNVYAKAGLDIGAFNPTIPVSVDGAYVLDLDANGDGRNLGGLKLNVNTLLAQGFTEDALGTRVDRVFADVAIGVNGRANIGYERGGFELAVPVAEGTFVYSGTRQGLFARGRSVEPFQGTPLAIFKPRGSIDIDALATRGGTFRLQASGTYDPFVYTMKGSLVVDNAGARASAMMTALGTNLRVSGEVRPDGKFTLIGNARVKLGPLSGTGSFSLRNTGRAVTFGAALDSRLSITIAGIAVGGRVNASMSIGANANGLVYSGGGSARLVAGAINIGPSFRISNNELAIRIDARPVLEAEVRVALPA
jgi:hypothetical protein